MAREAIVDQETGKVVNIHQSWEPPAGCIVALSDDAQIGDSYSEGVFTPSPERVAAEEAVADEEERVKQELSDAIVQKQNDLEALEAKKLSLESAISSLNSVEEKSIEQTAQLALFEDGLQTINDKINILKGE